LKPRVASLLRMAVLDAKAAEILVRAAGAAASCCLLLGRRPLGPERVLENPVRQHLLATIREMPGRSLVELRRAAGLGWGNLYHHLRRLQEAGLVETTQAGRTCLVFAKGAQSTRLLQRAALLRGATARWIAAYVLAHPGCNFKDVLAAAPVEQRTAYYHVQRLQEAELIRAGSKSRYFDLRPADDLAECLARADEN
jgi:predicted transcriptional regulator